MLNDYLRAWHAGRGSWGKDTDINSSSIGIELDNNGTEVFLTRSTKLEEYNIYIIGHSDT
jgi:N-acetylmuramoyl-L-alanine amidase